MENNQQITETIRARFSCRTYLPTPIQPDALAPLSNYTRLLETGPLGSSARFDVVAASAEDSQALKGLGTYGFIKNPAGFIIGAVLQAPNDMEDFGYLMEKAILRAGELGLGTCWLGGSFRRSAFADKMNLQPRECMPAVASLGYCDKRSGLRDRLIRRTAGSDSRLPFRELFFDRSFDTPLEAEKSSIHGHLLEMVRIAPSASNKQPWRVLRDGANFHFYLKRTPGYHRRNLKLVNIPDLQRVDIGIAMCHFDLSAGEAGLSGTWAVNPPAIPAHPLSAEYIATFSLN
jgi:nitroreductase